MPKTPEENQRAKSKKEAARFDKQRFGDDAELTEKEREKQKQRIETLKTGQDKAKEDRLNAVLDFDSDPIGFLKEKLSQGNYEGRDKQHNYLLLVTLVKIQQALESPDLNKLTGK